MATVENTLTAAPNQKLNRHFPRRLGLLCLLLLAANLTHFLTRSWEASFYQTSYSTIYIPTDIPVVRDWVEVEGGIEGVMNWSQSPDGWVILQDDKPYSENVGPNPFFPEVVDDISKHTYTAIAQPEGMAPPLKFIIQFLPRAYWDDVGLPRPSSYIIATDEINADFEQYPVSEWVDDYSYMDQTDLELVAGILTDEVEILETDTSLEKLEKLSIHLRDTLGTRCRGVPDHDDRWRTPLQIYQGMRDGTGKGWCTQQAQMFVFFANRAGLSSRIVVGAVTKGNNFIHTGHSWAETWIPEQGRWAWSDPSYALIYATDNQGRVLNSVELSELKKHAAWDGVSARIYKDWGWPEIAGEHSTPVTTDFPLVGDVIQRQFVTSAIYKWRRPPNVEDLRYDYTLLLKNREFFWGNLERYYFNPPLAYADYPTDGNQTYFIRHLLLWSFVASLLAFTITYRKSRK